MDGTLASNVTILLTDPFKEALGHNSKAVHRACVKRALMKISSLEHYEKEAALKIE
jgi:hypothetical protein